MVLAVTGYQFRSDTFPSSVSVAVNKSFCHLGLNFVKRPVHLTRVNIALVSKSQSKMVHQDMHIVLLTYKSYSFCTYVQRLSPFGLSFLLIIS